MQSVFLFTTSALQVETNNESLLFGPILTTIPNSFFNTVPVATVYPPALILASVVLIGKYERIAASQLQSQAVGVCEGVGALL